jgi:hypothetical protein
MHKHELTGGAEMHKHEQLKRFKTKNPPFPVGLR